MSNPTEADLQVHRDRIDAIDEQILELMNQRIAAARCIGAIKSSLDEPAFYRPEREARVLKRLRHLNQARAAQGQVDQAPGKHRQAARGQLDDAALEALFREIMSITRGAEEGLSVAILGPLGTYTEAAARQHFGSSIAVAPYATIDEIFRAAETGQTDFAVAPVENSTEGGVGETLDRLVTTSLLVCGEINLWIHHNLLARAPADSAGDASAADKPDHNPAINPAVDKPAVDNMLSSIKRVTAHAQSLAQCKRWLDRNLPAVERVAVGSNADAAIQARDHAGTAAIAGDRAAERYELHHLAANIEDEPGNATRFLVFSNRPTPPSGDDKTSLLLSCRNRPGALFHLLKPLLEHRVDMSKIESRPSKTGLWEYVFFVDIVGHQADPEIAQALDELKSEAGLYKNLGSYPAAS